MELFQKKKGSGQGEIEILHPYKQKNMSGELRISWST